MGLLNGPQVAKEYPLDHESKHDGEEDAHVCEHHETGIALREINTCRVEVWPLLEGGDDDSGGERGADGTICRETHLVRQNGPPDPVSPLLQLSTMATLVPCRCLRRPSLSQLPSSLVRAAGSLLALWALVRIPIKSTDVADCAVRPKPPPISTVLHKLPSLNTKHQTFLLGSPRYTPLTRLKHERSDTRSTEFGSQNVQKHQVACCR
jgi:hypothetical protein